MANLERIQREAREEVLARLIERNSRNDAVHFTLGWIKGVAGAFAVGRPAARLARIRGAIEAYTAYAARPAEVAP